MKKIFVYSLSFFFCCCGCDVREKEEKLQKEETRLNEKAAELQRKEQSLALKEEELNKRQHLLDSATAINDTTHLVNPVLAGNWNATMTCTETTCAGSAIGDTKNEQWQFAYGGKTLNVRVTANGQLVRVYKGYSNGNALELTEDIAGAIAPSGAQMIVRLQLKDDTHLEGKREIVRGNDCKIVYALQLEKQTD